MDFLFQIFIKLFKKIYLLLRLSNFRFVKTSNIFNKKIKNLKNINIFITKINDQY